MTFRTVIVHGEYSGLILSCNIFEQEHRSQSYIVGPTEHNEAT